MDSKKSTDPLTVRPAVASDVNSICQWNASLALETEEVHLDAESLRQGVQAVLDDPSKGFYTVAEINGKPAGALMVTYEWSDWRNAVFFWIQSVYVEEACRRQGVFSALFEHVRGRAAAVGACGIRLYVHGENEAARKVYERLGLVSHDYHVLETPDPLRE